MYIKKFLFTFIFLITTSLPSWTMENEDQDVRKNPSSVSSRPFVSYIESWAMDEEELSLWKDDEFNASPIFPPSDGLSVRPNSPESLFFTADQERLLRSLGIHSNEYDGLELPSDPIPELRAIPPVSANNSEYIDHSSDPFTPSYILSLAFQSYKQGRLSEEQLEGLKRFAMSRIPSLSHTTFQSVFDCVGLYPDLDLFLFDMIGTTVPRSDYLATLASLAWPTEGDFQETIPRVTFHVICLTNLWDKSFIEQSSPFSDSEIQSFLDLPLYSIFSVLFNTVKKNNYFYSLFVLDFVEKMYKRELNERQTDAKRVIKIVEFHMILQGKRAPNPWSTIDRFPHSNHILEHIFWPPDLPFTLFTPIESQEPSLTRDMGSQMPPPVPTNLSSDQPPELLSGIQHSSVTPSIVPLSTEQRKENQQSLQRRLADLAEWKTITTTYKVKTSTLRGNCITRKDKCPMTKQDYKKILLLLNRIDPHKLTNICKNKYELIKSRVKNKIECY
ncbi:MAG: hypothetical protein K2W92_06965 [Alphaproteobacteria bacterium]|nr:hypothetical protein [Alphaproteobacteria bacterium]